MEYEQGCLRGLFSDVFSSLMVVPIYNVEGGSYFREERWKIMGVVGVMGGGLVMGRMDSYSP